MNQEKILKILNNIQDEVSKIRDLLYCPEGIRITGIHLNDYAYVEFWDEIAPKPFLLLNTKDEIENKIFMHMLKDALRMIPISAAIYSKKIKLEINDLEYTEDQDVKDIIDIFNIEIKKLSNEEILDIRGRNDINNYLSKIKGI